MILSAEIFEQITEALRSDAQGERDKRLEPRVGLAGEASLIALTDVGQRRIRSVRVRDISRNGIGFSHDKRFGKGQRFILQLQARGAEPIWLLCQAAYCRRMEKELYTVGARISQVLKSDQVNRLSAAFGADGEMNEEALITAARISGAILK